MSTTSLEFKYFVKEGLAGYRLSEYARMDQQRVTQALLFINCCAILFVCSHVSDDLGRTVFDVDDWQIVISLQNR
jgi:hypothetical protein